MLHTGMTILLTVILHVKNNFPRVQIKECVFYTGLPFAVDHLVPICNCLKIDKAQNCLHQKWVACERKWTEDVEKPVSDYWQGLTMHKVPSFLFSFSPLQPLPTAGFTVNVILCVFLLTMEECSSCPFPCESLSHCVQLPASIRPCLLWQCGAQPVSVRWISFTVPWGIIRSQWASVTLPSLLRWLTPTAYQWNSSMTVKGAWGAFAIFKYLWYKWNVWINQYSYKEKTRARVLTPVFYVWPILGLFFLLSMHSQIIRREAPTDKNERHFLPDSGQMWGTVFCGGNAKV